MSTAEVKVGGHEIPGNQNGGKLIYYIAVQTEILHIDQRVSVGTDFAVDRNIAQRSCGSAAAVRAALRMDISDQGEKRGVAEIHAVHRTNKSNL